MRMHITARRAGKTAAVAGLVLTAAACGSARSSGGSSGSGGSGPRPTVKVAYMGDMHGAAPLAVGQHEGFWKKAGINVQAALFTKGPDEIAAMSSGSVNIAYIGPGALGGVAGKGNADVITLDSINLGDVVIGQPQYNSLSDMRGRTVGYAQGTSGEMILRLALRKAHLTMSDIKAKPMQAPEVVPAFDSGKIDFAATWVPLSTQIENKVRGAHQLASDRDFTSQLNAPQMWIVSKSFLRQHPAEVQKFLEGWILANNYRKQHFSKAVAITQAFLNNPSETTKVLASQGPTTRWLSSQQLLTAYQDGTAGKWLGQLTAILTNIGVMTSNVPAGQYTDWTPFEKAMKNLPK